MPCANHGCVFVERLLACQEGICPEELYCGPAVRFLLPKLASLSQTLATHRSQCNRWIRNTDMMTSSFEGIIIIIIIIRWGRDFPSVQTGPGALPASCTVGTGSFPGVKCGQGVTLTAHPLLVPRSWRTRAIPLPTLGAKPGL